MAFDYNYFLNELFDVKIWLWFLKAIITHLEAGFDNL